MSLPIEETIAHLSNNDEPLLSSKLVDLSSLNSEEMELFKHRWALIESKRCQQIIYRLVEMAEDNAELDFDSIFRICMSDKDPEVRSKAIEGLWESEDASLISPLIKLLEQDSSEKVQVAAATALDKFAMLAELEKLRSSYAARISHALLTVVGNSTRPVEVRCRALESAAPLSLTQVKKAIKEAYASHDSKLRVSAIYAMGKNCDLSWLPILLKELSNPDAETCFEAARACGELEEEEAVPYLIKLINNSDTEVQQVAIQALGKIGGTEAKRCLQQCLNDPGEIIQEAAGQALDELEAEEDPFSFR